VAHGDTKNYLRARHQLLPNGSSKQRKRHRENFSNIRQGWCLVGSKNNGG